MIKRKQSKPELIASYSLQAVLIATFLIALWKQEWIWVIGCFVAVFIGFIPSLIHKNINILLPWQIELLIATVATLNMVGVLLNAYYIIPGFGEITQFFTSVLVAFLAFAVIYILHVYWDGLIMDKYAMAFVVVLGTMASGVILEFVKWFKLFGTTQTSVEGVLTSLFISTLSGILIALIGVNLIKRGEFDELTEDLGKQFDSIMKQRKKKK
ncbi:MAG: hypothetical protein KGY65_05590 [Candidatus Thermoplasmatota archaeon]|nr:hypothetical protein [Candidatus Thermoplasmatota archaeon]